MTTEITYTPGAVGTLLLDRVKAESETYVSADAERKAETPEEIARVLAEKSDNPKVVTAREAIAKANDVIQRASADIATLLKDDVNAYAKNAAIAAAKVKEIRKNLSDLINAGELAEPGFREHVTALNLPGVKATSASGGGEGTKRPRVNVNVDGTDAVDANTGRSSFTAASKVLGCTVTDLQAAWLSASGKSDPKDVTDEVTFTFGEDHKVIVTKR